MTISPSSAKEESSYSLFDSMCYDFGNVFYSDTPLKCSFTLRNSSDASIWITNISTSCGCTNATWKKGEILSGEQTPIEITYKNIDEPYPFDKSIYVYTTLSKTPNILHIRGNIIIAPKSPRKMYSFKCGELGFINQNISLGSFNQGDSLSDSLRIYNFSKKETNISISSPDLYFDTSKYTIPPRNFIHVPFSLIISDSYIGDTTIPIKVRSLKRNKSSEVILQISLRAIPRHCNQHPPTNIKIANKFINLGKIIYNEDRDFSFDIVNNGTTSLKILKIDSPTYVKVLNSVTTISQHSSQTISLTLTDKERNKNGKVAIISIYNDSSKDIEYVYVSYQIPGILDAITTKLRR